MMPRGAIEVKRMQYDIGNAHAVERATRPYGLTSAMRTH